MTFNRIYKVVVVEDEPVILQNIIQKVTDASSFFTVAGNARNGRDAIEIINSIKPDVLLTDIRMPKMGGLELISLIKDKYPDMHLIILSGYDDFQYAQKAMKLGVRDYLLKPLNTDSLKETLTSIKTRLDISSSDVERDILFSGVNGLLSDTDLPTSLNNERFSIFLICIGHLCNYITSGTQSSFFSGLWAKINWNLLLPQNTRWWVIDEKQPNQKVLIISSAEPNECPDTIAYHLKELILEYVHPLPVNICAGAALISYNDIWFLAQKLRLLMDRHLTIGKSRVMTPSALDKPNMNPAILDMTFQNKISALIHQGNRVLLQHELYDQFGRWDESEYPQRWVEKVLHQLVKLFHRQFSSFSEEDISQMEYDVNEKLSVSSRFSCVHEDIWLIFHSMLMSVNDEKDDMQELINKVEQYIKANYVSELSIEDIARKFCLNPTYLTKLFKKYKNTAPAKYIISLRINEAKRLIATNPELGIKEIGEIIGYTDQHYFSRIFKGVTGKTPSEFKESI